MNEESIITAIFAGAGGLVIAISKLNTDIARRRKSQAEYQEVLIATQEETIQKREIQVIDCERHIFSLEQLLARAGIEAPPRPDSLSSKFNMIEGKKEDD